MKDRREYFRQYYKKNRERKLAQRRQYVKEHKEEVAKYYLENKEKKRAYSRAFRKKYMKTARGKLMHRHHTTLRKARKNALVADFTPEQWQQKLEEHNYRCAYCYEQRSDLQQEHIVPVSKGGGYTWNNIVPACESCNKIKRTKDLLVFIEEIYSAP